ncbi:hypothetical protein C7B61_03790 [filamentous cyanobacterium CCP1]|nr:hypothetical protein C7B76_00140 [filamentous cyanobacterium CCP2]PSB67888.1 hypothetical protein C7B61_03790 [filamentous cyanobacterium CCP1]
MRTILFDIGIPFTILIGIGLWWRFAARQRSLPCPPWLGWSLENGYMNAVASSATLLDRLEIASGMRVLDIGCGPGRITIPAAERVGPNGEVVALDIQQGMLDRVAKRVRERNLTNVRMIRAGAGEGKLEHHAFDRAWLVTVLGEIPDREAALREVYEALKPNGVLSITEVIPDPHYQSQSTVRRLAEEAGFRFDRLYGNWLAFTMNFVRPTNP